MVSKKTSTKPKCGRKTKGTGKPCKNPAGLRTNHPGHGACYKHGGASDGAPKGNKNAVTTGEYESIYAGTLTDEENAAYQAMDTSPLRQATEQVKLLTIREVRMLARIKDLKEQDEAQPEEQRGFGISSITTRRGWDVKGKVDYTEAERTSTLDSILKLEEALTRIQALKRAAIEQLRKTIAATPPDGNDPVLEMIRAIRDSR